ncbi:MAG TPA: hypothetical protein VH253_00175 [Phycisphaerae bacterium]|nr:hypothetical protein [Phycisphaerae bacterium]
MADAEPAGGDILVYAKVNDPEARVRLRQLLDDLPGERVNGSIYEVFTADWDEGLWDDEVVRMQELIDPATDTLIFWRIVAGKLSRTSLAGKFA